jgi:acyl-coenzyme A synthetase/AMP-(fatty) acid ligase
VTHGRRPPGAAQGRDRQDPRDVDRDTVLHAGATDPAASLEVAATDPLYVLTGAGEAGNVRGNGAHAVAAAWVVAQVLDGHSASVWWATFPLSTGVGQLLSLYAPLIGGLTTVLHDTAGPVPTVQDLGSVVSRHGVDVVLTTADVVRSWRDEGSDPGITRRLKVLAVVDEPLDPDTLRWAGDRLAEEVLGAAGEGPSPEDPFLAPYGVPALTDSSSSRPD